MLTIITPQKHHTPTKEKNDIMRFIDKKYWTVKFKIKKFICNTLH